MLKKVTLCLVAILGSTAALAAGPADVPLPIASGVDLMAPHQEGSWSFGLQANYFQPNNDFNYALEQQAAPAGLVPNSTQNQVNTYAVGSDNDWGWGADITYHFPGDGRDVTLAFTQLNTSDSDSASTDDNTLAGISAPGASAFGKGSFGRGNYTDATGEVKTNYDSADLTFGQVITAGSRITLHPFAGVRYSYIDYKATGDYTRDAIDSSVTPNTEYVQQADSQTIKSTFSGAGPRLGSDAAVNLGSGFSLRGTLGVSLLVGSMDVEDDYTTANYTSTSGVVSLNSISDTDHDLDTNTRVVPEADAKLAAMYHADFNNGYGLGFEVGYQVTNYFNAIENSTISTVDTSTEYTDFFMQGPYARIQLDVA